jgi:hypothetical protein
MLRPPSPRAALAALLLATPLAAQQSRQRSTPSAPPAAVSDSFPLPASCTSRDSEEISFAFDDFDAACLARLEQAAARCPSRGAWRVDFRGDGRPRLVQWRRCPAPREGDVVDYVLVRRGPTRSSRVEYAFDNSQAPGFSSIEIVSPLALERRGDRRGLYVVSILSGTGGYIGECLLGPRDGDAKLGCWPLPQPGTAMLGRLRDGETTGSRDVTVWRVDPAGAITYVQVARRAHDMEAPAVVVQVEVRLRNGRYVVARTSRHRQAENGGPE